MKTKSMFSKPRPKGWLSPIKQQIAKSAPKRVVVRCTTAERAEREASPHVGPVRGSGYLLASCVVLAATVIGTRRAYFTAKEILPAARAADHWRFI